MSPLSLFDGPISRAAFTAYLITMFLLLAGTILICILTPAGQQFIYQFNLGLIMDFSTTTVSNIASGLSWLAVLMVVGAGLYGMSEEDSFIGGAVVGLLVFGALCLVITVVWNYVVPFIVNAVVYIAIVAACLAFSFGSSVAIVNYFHKLITYINPYPLKPGVYRDEKRYYYRDTAKRREDFDLCRSYFFGPGFFSIVHTIRDAWKANFRVIKRLYEWLGDFGIPGMVLGFIPLVFFSLSVAVFGSAATIACSAVHVGIILPVMILSYILFTLVWLVDRVYLQIKSIKTSCPYDQTRSVIPIFACPWCENKHKQLVPGPYGIFHRRCTCGRRLPTTFLLGRSSLKSYCRQCGHKLAASDVQQFAISVVGGSGSGKTVYLSAFFHELFNLIDQSSNVSYEIPDIHKDDFSNLTDWFNGARCDATEIEDATARMYSVILRSPGFDVDRQFSLYDIAGEVFRDPEMKGMLPQRQMRDSNGVIIVIDPLSSAAVLEEVRREGEGSSDCSEDNAALVISNYAHYLKNIITRIGTKRKSSKPVAVVISKADIDCVKHHISYQAVEDRMLRTPEKYASISEARDEICREYLFRIGLGDAVSALDANFSEVHYFPVSAIGHAANGQIFSPDHVMEPVCWLVRYSDPEIAELLQLKRFY